MRERALGPKGGYRRLRRPHETFAGLNAAFTSAGRAPYAAGAASASSCSAKNAISSGVPAVMRRAPGAPNAPIGRAIQALVAVPVLREDVPLVPHAIGFRYADPALEGLTAAQKQFLRIGPRNVRLVQGKLRELEAALAPPAERPAAP